MRGGATHVKQPRRLTKRGVIIILDSAVRPPTPALPRKRGARSGAGLVAAVPDAPMFSYRRKRQIFLVLLGAPALIYVLAIAVWPLAQGVGDSFYNYSLLRPARTAFIGFDNYRRSRSNSCWDWRWRSCCGATACSIASAWRCC
jgi:hypothetical protein